MCRGRLEQKVKALLYSSPLKNASKSAKSCLLNTSSHSSGMREMDSLYTLSMSCRRMVSVCPLARRSVRAFAVSPDTMPDIRSPSLVFHRVETVLGVHLLVGREDVGQNLLRTALHDRRQVGAPPGNLPAQLRWQDCAILAVQRVAALGVAFHFQYVGVGG